MQQGAVAQGLVGAQRGQFGDDQFQILQRQGLGLLLWFAVKAGDAGQGLAHGGRGRGVGKALVHMPLRQGRQAQGQGTGVQAVRMGHQVADDGGLVGGQRPAPSLEVANGGTVGAARVVRGGGGEKRLMACGQLRVDQGAV
ncbi:hypothetical protein D3C81_1604060 [compost metagenome]